MAAEPGAARIQIADQFLGSSCSFTPLKGILQFLEGPCMRVPRRHRSGTPHTWTRTMAIYPPEYKVPAGKARERRAEPHTGALKLKWDV